MIKFIYMNNVSNAMDISDLRNEYTQSGLNRDSLNQCPFTQFDIWFKQAQEVKIFEVNAMSISTVSSKGVPSCRTVLLKIYDQQGFVFFTNYDSDKAKDIESNPNVALLFPWLSLERQVRITGTAEKITKKESFAYFTSRPKGSQLGAWISPQSQMIESRDFLKAKLAEIKAKFSNGKIPLPNAWGGFRIIPTRFEFWQGRTSRLHDRFVYEKSSLQSDSDWGIKRLAP